MTSFVSVRAVRVLAAVLPFTPLVFAPASLAQATPGTPTEKVVITANRVPVLASKVGSSVEVLTEQDLQAEARPFLKDALEALPGVNFSQFGPPGTQANLTIRGAAGNYIVVRIDGMEMSDNSGSSPSTALEHLQASDVVRVEVLKGSQSALYGGQAVGGVIEITTRRPEPNSFSQRVFASAGSFRTREGTYTLNAAGERAYVSTTLSGYDSDGFSAFNQRRGGVEDDGYRNLTFSTKAGIDLDNSLSLSATVRATKYRLEYDDSARDNLTNRYTGRTVGGRINAEWRSQAHDLRHSLALENFKAHRNYEAFAGLYDGTRSKLEYLGSYRPNAVVAVTWGADWRKDGIELSPGAGNAKADTRLWGVFGEVGWAPLKNLNFTAALREDKHEVFGSKTTQRATMAWELTPRTKLRASYGTGFTPPSLFQLYSLQFGSLALQPESSRSRDIGLEQSFGQGRFKVGLTRFQLDSENLIGFDRVTRKFFQIGGKTTRDGWELATAWVVNPVVSLNANYTRIDTATATGQRLQRVPGHDGSVSVRLQPMQGAGLALRVNRIVDIPEPAAPGGRLPAYTVVNLTASYALSTAVDLTARVDNLLNEKYETTFRYGTAERSAYVGVKARF